MVGVPQPCGGLYVNSMDVAGKDTTDVDLERATGRSGERVVEPDQDGGGELNGSDRECSAARYPRPTVLGASDSPCCRYRCRQSDATLTGDHARRGFFGRRVVWSSISAWWSDLQLEGSCSHVSRS